MKPSLENENKSLRKVYVLLTRFSDNRSKAIGFFQVFIIPMQLSDLKKI